MKVYLITERCIDDNGGSDFDVIGVCMHKENVEKHLAELRRIFVDCCITHNILEREVEL